MKISKVLTLIGFCGLASTSYASSAVSFEAPFAFLQESNDQATKSRSSDEPEILAQIDAAMTLIMRTKVGLAICQDILKAQPKEIAFHLGVSASAANKIAKGCSSGKNAHPWVQPSPVEALQKFSVNPLAQRHYLFVINGDLIPFDSWTEPYSNTTVFVIHSQRDKPINRSRLIQLLAHETAVYFDAKAQLGHDDSRFLPQLANLSFITNGPATSGKPQVAVMNPVIAHTLTFVRAMIIEREIVSEISSWGELEMPEEYSDPLIANLTSRFCDTPCLEDMVAQMSDIYLPLSLPMTAFSPTYRSQKRSEIASIFTKDQAAWTEMNLALSEFPQLYIDSLTELKQKPFMELIQFFANPAAMPMFGKQEAIFRKYLWPTDWQSVLSTRVKINPQEELSLLLFMKQPLLSGYNILFSNGPRVRIRAGDAL